MARPLAVSSSSAGPANGSTALRYSRFNAFLVLLFHSLAPTVMALPLFQSAISVFEAEDAPKSPADASLWIYLGTAIALVLLGGAFAGLTIALMGQDEIYLQVIAHSGEGAERSNAKKVLRLLNKGKHWVLVTLLLSNVITNETLPIVLDRSLGGGWPAVLSSTVLIVIFGEIVPQSICVRYGLPIGAWMSPVVLGLMYFMAPVAWPTAKLLDHLLGEDHGTTYKKAGLKTLVTLHKTLGTSPDERLNQDEVTIITAVLDLKSKPVGNIMTPIDDVFTMSSDTILDESMMETILSAGYSRIPIHVPDNEENFIGMLLVKMLITYDPEDALRVRDFALATLPETRPETSCLDIINFFQEGKSHMVLVSDNPGDPNGAVGVVTLEDVIEELIGEEIIDESDVFVDVHKAVRRMQPAPRYRVPKGEVVVDPTQTKPGIEAREVESDVEHLTTNGHRKLSLPEGKGAQKRTTHLVRRRSSGHGKSEDRSTLHLRNDDPELRQHLKHLGPSNVAARPKSTRIPTVKIKSAIPNTIPENAAKPAEGMVITPFYPPSGGVGEGILDSAGREASDGVHSVAVGYGTMAPDRLSSQSREGGARNGDEETALSPKAQQNDENKQIISNDHGKNQASSPSMPTNERSHSVSTIGSLRSIRSDPTALPKRRHTARSGSISENIVDVNGVKKIVLETTNSSDSDERGTVVVSAAPVNGNSTGSNGHGKASGHDDDDEEDQDSAAGSGAHKGEAGAKKKRKKRGKKKKADGSTGETQPLLSGGR